MKFRNVNKKVEKKWLWSYPSNPPCPYCGCQECVLDNGDSWYCDACNATFGNH